MNIKLPSGELRIGGKKITTEKTLPVISPSTEEIIGEICVASEKDVALAVETANEAFKSWRSVSLDHRISYIRKFRELALGELEELGRIDAIESGKPLMIGTGDAIFGCVVNAKYYEMFSKDFLKARKVSSPFPYNLMYQMKKSHLIFSPLGAIGIISPANVPIFLSMIHILPALVAGNTVILKPSNYGSFAPLKVYEMFEEAGLPPGVFNVVPGDAETGSYLTKSKVRKIIFTGSTRSGKKILENCAQNLTPASLELGGDNAMIVLKDADIDRAASGAVFGAFWNSGQICLAPKRIIVAKEIKDEIIRMMVERTKKLKIGDPINPSTVIGPLIYKRALDDMDRFIQDAVSKGAKIECGGKRIAGKGCYYEPTVLSNVNMSMFLAYEEVFGPVMSIFDFETEEEAIAINNFPEYGLTSSLWSRDIKKAEELAGRIEAGTIWINDSPFPESYTPYGGMKKSGFSRSLCEQGLLDVTVQKSISLYQKKLPFCNPLWFPWTTATIELMTNATRMFFRDSLRGKLTNFINWLKYSIIHEKEYKDFIK